ncbi:MAG: GNAT family N-acetyltransferase [Chloroflexi bacterium]|nr:GNAT family N-acetyltransferase [Chloroflexota bacterium]
MEDDRDQSDIHIRLAIPEDAIAIASVLHESFVEFEALYTPAAFTATTPSSEIILRRLDEGPIWVATSDGIVVGTVSVVGKSEGLYVRSMAVLPTSRGKGIANMLLEAVENWAAGNGYRYLILSTTPFLLGAIRTYERFGFQRNDSDPHDLDGTPLFTMTKVLI